MKPFKALLDFFLFSNIFISLCAAAASLQACRSFNTTTLKYAAFVFCSTFVFYNTQRILLSGNYLVQYSSPRHKWILKNRKSLIILSVLALFTSIPFISDWPYKMILIFSGFGCLAVFYFLPLINLRAIPGIKAIYIALLWTFATAYFPLYLLNYELVNWDYYFHLPAMFPILQRFFFILTLAVAFNMRDISIDRKAGIKTFPVLFGETKTKILCLLLLLLFCGMMPYPFTGTGQMLVLSAVATGILILFASEKRREYYYSLLLDGMILLQFLLVYLAIEL